MNYGMSYEFIQEKKKMLQMIFRAEITILLIKKILEDKSLIHTYFVKLHCKKKNQQCFCFTSGDMDMKIDVIECTCTCMFSKGWVFPTSLGLYLGPGTGGTMSDGVQR